MDEPLVAATDLFSQDPEMPIEELADGSAIVEIPEEEKTPETGHFDNLAETLDPFKLNVLAATFLDLIEKDKEARKKRDEQYAEGIRRTGLGDEAPGGANFAGASRAVHPVLAEGCIDFAARASKELFPPRGPVKTRIFGEATREKINKAKRKCDYLNFLLTKKMRSYRDEKEVMLTQLPLGGSQYEKYYPDPQGGGYVMEFVPVDKVLLPYAANSFYDTPRLTHIVELTRAKFEARIRDGFYKDIRIGAEPLPDTTAAEDATNKIQGAEEDFYNEDGLRTVYEVSCDYDVEGDGIAPYIIHIDAATQQIVAIYRNWREGDASKKRLDWWVENKFIPWRGPYGIGLPHLIGSLSGALTGALRALLDAAHINNSPGAVKLKSGRTSGQNIVIEQTQIAEIDAPPGANDIRQVIMPLPFNPPSPVLFQLLDWITAQAKGVVATAEEKIADATNQMPVGTALALIEQGSHVFSSIHARLHEAQRRGLEIICRLVHDFPVLEDLQRFGLTPEDFAENDDIDPVSDPSIFSEAQRFALLQERMKLIAAFPQLPWKIEEVAKQALELLRVDDVDSWLPTTPPPVTADPVTENFMAIMANAQPKVAPEQDHVAHLQAHLAFITDPTFGAGPAIAGNQLAPILKHCQEHLMQVYLGVAKTAAAIRAMKTGEGTELTMAQATTEAMQLLQQQIGTPLTQLLQQAAQIVQSKMPQPPVDPAVQKTFEAAMAKTQSDERVSMARLQVEQQIKQAELQLRQAETQFSAQIEEQKRQFEQRMTEMDAMLRVYTAEMQERSKQQAEELRQQVELLKNQQDNEQHQITELLKNYQDNLTQLQIAMQRVKDEVAVPDFSPQVEQLNKMLAELEGAKTLEALTATVEGLREAILQLNRPKMIIEDENGKPIGIR